MTALPNDFTPHMKTESEESLFDLRKLFFKYFAYWKWFLLSFIILVTLGFCYVATLPPQYKISASIMIKDHKKGEGVSTLEELDLFYRVETVENELEILRSYTLLEEAVDELNLQVLYTVEGRWRPKELYGNLPFKIEIISPTAELFSRPFILQIEADHFIFDEKTYPSNALINEPFGSILISTVNDSLLFVWDNDKPIIVQFIPKAVLLESLRNSLQVSLTKNTSVINLSILSPVPRRGEDFLNQLIIAYNKAAVNDKNNLAATTLSFIEERLEGIEKNLRKAEHNVEQFKVDRGITDISAESALFLNNIQNADLELSKVKTQLDVLQQIQQYVLSNDGSATPATLGLSDPTLVSLIATLIDAEAERILLLSSTGRENPRVKGLDDRIQTLKANLIENISVLRRSLEATQRNLRVEKKRMENVINSLPQKERELIDFTRQQEVINQIYVLLLSKREETAISYAATVADSRVVDIARSTSMPVKPNKRLILMFFAFVGMLFPMGVIWLKDSFKTSITTKDDIENRLKVPVVGEISFVEQANKIVFLHKNKSRQAEQIRSIRTNIEFMHATGGNKVILISSSISNEGKSFLSANIGVAYAAIGKRTVLLGFDLRKPGLDKVFGIDNSIGLSNYLTGQAPFDQIIQPTEISEYLHIITCGYLAPNPQELLLGHLLPPLFEHLKAIFDCIIVDTSPVGIMSDALILDRYADVTLYVIRQNYTPLERIKQINALFFEKRMNNIGVVVNGIKEEKWNGYGYGYSYGYGSKDYY